MGFNCHKIQEFTHNVLDLRMILVNINGSPPFGKVKRCDSLEETEYLILGFWCSKLQCDYLRAIVPVYLCVAKAYIIC